MLTKKRIPFQTFQWFDGLTMSGFILNRCASFKALRPVQMFKVQEFKERATRSELPSLRS
jgi:hypothetical protein